MLALDSSRLGHRSGSQHFDGILGISQHSKFRQVEALELHFSSDPHRANPIHDGEAQLN